MFEALKRDGAARIGTLILEEKAITTPSLIFIHHERFPIGEVELSRHLSIKVREGKTMLEGRPLDEMEDILRGTKIRGDPKEIASMLVKTREKAGYSKALYLPGTGAVHDYAMMVYAGAELFDTSLLILYARKGYYLTEYGPVPESEWEKERCNCPACSSGEKGFGNRMRHNYRAALGELAIIREFIKKGRLRHLMEMRIRARPEAVAVLRHLDREHYSYFRRRLPFVGGGVKGVSEDTLHSPEVRYYRERLKGYRKPAGEVLLLLPCSARKPYSLSKSHRLFTVVTRDFHGLIHEVIVTSPLGIVPRELEGFYPAADYDIAVTGEWSAEEKEMVKGMFFPLFRENRYFRIINHTPYEFVSGLLIEKGVENTVVDGRPTSRESLRNLRKALEVTTISLQPVSSEAWKKSAFRNMWSFQFGPNSDKLIEGKKVKGKFPFLKLFDGEQLAMFVPRSRRFSLTFKGAELLGELKHRVFIADFMPTGDIFALGIEDADPGIMAGDEVAIVHGDELRGVGVALMNSEELVEARRGAGVKIRHRKK